MLKSLFGLNLYLKFLGLIKKKEKKKIKIASLVSETIICIY